MMGHGYGIGVTAKSQSPIAIPVSFYFDLRFHNAQEMRFLFLSTHYVHSFSAKNQNPDILEVRENHKPRPYDIKSTGS